MHRFLLFLFSSQLLFFSLTAHMYNVFLRFQATKSVFLSLHQDVTHGFDVFVSIIWAVFGHISACVGIHREPSCAKPNSGITTSTVIFLVTNNSDSCFSTTLVATYSITLQCYSCAVRRPVNQSASSTFCDPWKLHGIYHQRSVSTGSWPAC